MKPLIAGNWKMNGLADASGEIEDLIQMFSGSIPESVDVAIFPPATLLMAFAASFGDEGLEFGGQDCHAEPSGAFTGDVSAEMLADAGAAFVIVGHSERRQRHLETDAMILEKAKAALRAGLTPIVCVGETAEQRAAGDAVPVVEGQVKASVPETGEQLIVAYEPVWAIGAGKTPTMSEIADMHAAIRRRVGDKVRILYGGSVKPQNAKDVLAVENVNGALVGGASLKADDFASIVRAI